MILSLITAAFAAKPTVAIPPPLEVTPDLTADELVAVLVGSGVQTQNATLTVAAGSASASFTGGMNSIGFDNGIILSTGSAADVPGPNEQDDTSTEYATPGDPDLTEIAGVATVDAAVLEFDFRCESIDSISFQYVFTSEEYNEWVDSDANDAFAFFVDGTNIALLPDGVTPVSINTVNCGNPYDDGDAGAGCQYYINNDCSDLPDGTFPCATAHYTEMDGLTVVFDAEALVTAGQWHHMKIAIADGFYKDYDSNVFIKGASLVCGAPDNLPATVTTAAISAITSSSAAGGGNITNGGSTPVTVSGLCWKTSSGPTIADCNTTDGSATGSFTSSLADLAGSTIYYVRAYATNDAGTSYGNEVTFTTLAETDTDGDGTPDGSDGCPDDPDKIEPGTCGCGIPDTDTDSDGTLDCDDQCPSDPNKTEPGTAGCGTAEPTDDGEEDGEPDDTADGTPDLQVTIVATGTGQAGAAPKVGDELPFLVDVRNVGDGQASSVLVTVPLPSNVEVVSARLITGPSAADLPENITLVGSNLIIDLGDIPPGEQIQLELILRAMGSGDITLEPTVQSEGQPEEVKAAMPPLKVQDNYEMIVTTYRPLSLCGSAGMLPLMAIGLMLGLQKRLVRNGGRNRR